MFTESMLRSALNAVAAISLAALPLASGVAAPPGGGTSPPPVVDIAYMNVNSNTWTSVRGLQVAPTGAASGDVGLWKQTGVYINSLSWDPGGNWLAWAQYLDKAPAIVAGRPGSALTTVLKFPNGNITRRHGIDNLAWGRGCNGRSVIVFLGDELWEYLDVLYVFDPFVVGAQARRLYVIKHGPEGSPGRGSSMAFSPQGQQLAFAEQDDEGRNHVVALPLTCLPGDALPTAAGLPQRLFPVHSDAGVDGGRASTVGLDWSPDGSRLAASVSPLLVWQPGYQSWGVARIAVGELAYSSAGGVEQVSAAEPTMHIVTSGPAPGQADYSDELPSWGPSSATVACDRMAFSRSGALMLLDVPRNGFTSGDCTVPAPRVIGSKSVSGLDWK
jgi:hypothetical protein